MVGKVLRNAHLGVQREREARNGGGFWKLSVLVLYVSFKIFGMQDTHQICASESLYPGLCRHLVSGPGQRLDADVLVYQG